ncbi:uncharacterized protein [Ptychodera flava]|uniref:uncharacterized protein n=1 Tax=Ptychodera flava TaxID=63121 RepID=UPI00396A463B
MQFASEREPIILHSRPDMTAIHSSNGVDPTTDSSPASRSYIQLEERGYSDTVMNSLNGLREQAILTDAIICVEDQELHCHKVVLSSCSDVFCQMFSTSTNDTTHRIHTSIVSADTMRQLVDFVYKGKVEVQSSELKKLHSASKYFGVSSLGKLCDRFLGISRHEPDLNSVGNGDVEAGRRQNSEILTDAPKMSVFDSDTQAHSGERVRVKEENKLVEVGDRMYRNVVNCNEVIDWESSCHGSDADNSVSTQCSSTTSFDVGNEGQCQSAIPVGERSDTYGTKTSHEKTISVKTEPVLLDDPEHRHSRSYQDGDTDFYSVSGRVATHQSSADTYQDLDDDSDDDSQQFYIATELNDDATATGDSFQGERRGSTELTSMATEWIAAAQGANPDSDNTWQQCRTVNMRKTLRLYLTARNVHQVLALQ